MEIGELWWEEHNLIELAGHRITRGEVESVVDNDAWVAYVHPRYPEQVRVIGPTSGGRFLTVVLEPEEEPGVWRPVTGWDATPGERQYYRENYR
ncbi:MAG TPA: hypothetical protein VFX49_10495 [Chloroflexota bacterium]|nr:hypothetical protein [Chloroflexota bacterium]